MLFIFSTELLTNRCALKIKKDSFYRVLYLWVEMDSNHRRRKPADLQSAPFGHSGIHPYALGIGCKIKS